MSRGLSPNTLHRPSSRWRRTTQVAIYRSRRHEVGDVGAVFRHDQRAPKRLSVEQRRLPQAHLRERQNHRQRLFVDLKLAREPPRHRAGHAPRLRPRNRPRLPDLLVDTDREAEVRGRNRRRPIRSGQNPRRADRHSQAGNLQTASELKLAW